MVQPHDLLVELLEARLALVQALGQQRGPLTYRLATKVLEKTFRK